MVFLLGPWLVEPERNVIFRNGTESRVTPKAMDLLVFLARRQGDVVSRDSIVQGVWEGAAVTDDAVTRCVGELRRAFEEDARKPAVLETISRRGYRIIAPVDWNPASPAPPISPPIRPRRRITALALVAAAILASLAAAGLRFEWFRSSPAIRSLVVLPLDDHSQERQEYLAEGMTEALITELAQIKSLRVISRTSAMHYRRSGKPVAEIARELAVDGIVEGSVLRSGNRIRITAQLIHAASDSHIWSHSFERDLGDIVSLQGEIARSIAEQLRIALTAEEERLLRRSRAVPPDAYDAFLIGQYFQARFQFSKAADAFEQATRIHPTFARAHAMLCESDSMVAFSLEQQPGARTLRALERARSLDDSLAEVHMIAADKLFYWDWDWAAGEAEFRRAAEIDPGSSEVAVHYMMCLHAQARWDEALRECRRALHLDPASPRLNTLWTGLLIDAGRYQEALSAYANLVKLDSSRGDRIAGRLYDNLGRDEEALTAYLKADALSGLPSAQLRQREAAARKEGLRGYWRAVLAEQTEEAHRRPVGLALLNVQAGRNEEALRLLEIALRQRNPRLVWLKAKSEWHPLRSDPRFRSILRSMRFE